MKTLHATDLQVTNRQFKLDSVIRQIETIFQDLQFPDVEGIQIYQLLSDNLHYEGDGVYAVQVNTLQGEVEFVGSPHSVWLRNHAGVLQYSNDYSTWAAVGSGGAGGAGDMDKATYDPQDTGRVLKAERLSDATHETTAAQMATHRADSAIHFAQTDIDHGNLQNRGTRTHAELEADITALQAGGGSGGGSFTGVIPNLELTPIASDATAPAPTNAGLLLFARLFPEGQRGLAKGKKYRPIILQKPMLFVVIDGQEKQVCTLDYDAVHLKDILNAKYLPPEAMQTAKYVIFRDEMVDGELMPNHPTETVKKAERLRVMETGEEVLALAVADHLKGRVVSRLPLDGTDNIACDLNTSALYVKDNNGVAELWVHFSLGGVGIDTLITTSAQTPPASLGQVLLVQSEAADGTADFTDASPSAHVLTIAGTPTHSTDYAKFGSSAIKLTGTNAILADAPSPDYNFGTGDFTVMAWVYLLEHSGEARTILSNSLASDQSQGWWFGIAPNVAKLTLSDISALAADIPLNTWVHVAAVRYGNTLTLYQQGVTVKTADVSGRSFGQNAGDGVAIGRLRSSTSSGGFNWGATTGYLEDIAIYKGSALYTSDFTPPTSPITPEG